jgi:hypothetical protein
LIIADAQLAHDREIYRNIEANVKVHGEARRAHVTRLIRERYNHSPRPVGTVHDETESDCPEGLPNCRNCGDPAHVESCHAAGHCPHCGTRHGIAPDAHVAANGYRLEPL